tara:strand:- start:3529 stop:4605 length:1077 start_codon:yes stop_codon:yes gene_type:complete
LKNPKLKVAFQIFGIIAIILTLLPFVAMDFWWVRIFDFPHLQLTFLTISAIVIYLIKFDFIDYRDYIFMALLVACAVYQSVKLYPYTTFADYQVQNSSSNIDKTLKVLTANLLQENKKYESFIDEVKSVDADILLLTEVNNSWQEQLSKELEVNYGHKVEYPLDNTYGMSLYSKYPLAYSEVKFLVSDSIPSIHTKIKISNVLTIQLYGIHPTPPMPQENPKSTDRDSELMQIALLSRNRPHPVIVLGDFNDVAWSQTSKLFHNVSELLDARIGRGLFSTFSAKSWILRWPLDHIFISEEFRVKTLKSGNDISSDHFPFYTELTFEPDKAKVQKAPPATTQNINLAKKQITKELKEQD